jgi:hypothetical protein
MARHRCTECREWFTPAVTACGHQRVCGEGCRRRRRCKLARGRRRRALEEHREDERARQQKRRDAAEPGARHELASDGKSLELLLKLQQIVDKAALLSRATFRREALRILRRNTQFASANVDEAGRCHERPSSLATAENGSRSVVCGDGVTDRDGM